MITIFKNIKSTATPYHREIEVAFERIKNGKSRELVEKIRNETNKEKRNELKMQLPSICFSGVFTKRAADYCIEHSGYICLDFDGFESEIDLAIKRAELKSDKYTFALFTSPSGNGLKVIVKIPPEIENHKGYFKKLQQYYNCEHFDISTKDISRVCYESFDEDIFINKDSELWTKKELEEFTNDNKPTVPLTSSSVIVANLQKWFDENYIMIKGNRNANLYIFASALNDYGISKHEANSYLIRSYESSDFSSKEISKVVESAYKHFASHGTKFFEDTHTKKQIKKRIQSGEPIKQIASEFTQLEKTTIERLAKETENVNEFWEFDKKGCHILNLKFKNFLEQNGFCKYYPEGSEMYIFVRCVNNFVENTNPQKIKDFVLDYLLTNGHEKPYELLASATKYFKEDYLSLLEVKDLKLYEDSIDFGMLYFKNKAVRVFAEKIEEIDYLDLDGMVWRHHIINRDFEYKKSNDSYFERFVKLAGGDGYSTIENTIGYMMHSYKTSANNKAVIFNDKKISDNPNGGSGKGIICNAVSKMKRVCILDGKQFDFNKTFAYQLVSADTQLLVFDDVVKKFNFEALFSLITEGITLEKKNKDAIKIPVHRSPKIVITTNYTIGGVGGSFERRKHEIELTDYFNSNHTPLDEFNIMLFDDFTQKDWSEFDNYMINCLKNYLKNGLIKYNSDTLHSRKFIQDTSYEFFEWSNENIQVPSERLYKDRLFEQFTEAYPDYNSRGRYKLSQIRFSKWLDCFGLYKKVEVQKGKENGSRAFVLFSNIKENESFFDNIKIEEHEAF